MLRRTFLTLATAACLTAVYGLYSRFVGAQLQPVISRTTDAVSDVLPVRVAPRENVSQARKHLLQRAPWAASAKYQLRTDQAFVYSEECQSLEADGVVQFKPFAMIWFQDGEADGKQPITMVADSALVQFASKFDLTKPNPDRVVGGKLDSDVVITGPDGLLIHGRNFIFEETAMHIRSDNAVEFSYGPHRGRADGVQIELIPNENGDAGSPLAASGIHSIRLFRNVVMNLALEESHKQSRSNIRCTGGFEFVLQTNTATFEDDVRMIRPTGFGESDTLRCDILKLFFERGRQARPVADAKPAPANDLVPTSQFDAADRSTTAKEQSKQPFQGLTADLTFRKLTAEGRTVVLTSQSNQLTARMAEMEYDAAKKVAVLRGGNRVHVSYGPSELDCPEITLIHNEDGKIVSAWCRGAGQLTHRDPKTGSTILTAHWLKQLHKYPEPRTGLDIIELKDQAILRQPNQKQGIKADLIKIWFDGQRRSAGVSADNQRVARSRKSRPRHLLALKNVVVVSPELQGRTKHLQVWFDERSAARSAPKVSRGRESRNRLQPALRRRPKSRGQSESASSASKRPGQRLPVILNADMIHVRVLDDPAIDDPQLAEVWSEGNVRVWQEQKKGGQTLDLTGNRLQLYNTGESRQVVRVSGVPARIREGVADIAGPEIFLDRDNNLTWIEGPGQLRLPVKNDFEGKPLQKPSKLKITWRDRMQFDGQTGKFWGNVHADLKDQLTDHRMRCQQMQIELSKRIDFSQNASEESTAKIRNVICKEGVEFFSHEYAAKKQIGIRRAKFWEFSVNTLTGKTTALGPGEVTVWRRGSGKRAAISPAAVAQANQPLRFESPDWEYTRIVFAGQTSGNLKQRHTTFHDQVRIVYGPVQQPLDVIDPDNLPKDAGVMRCDLLHFAQQPETKSHPSYIELRADGNAQLEGQRFYARADIISYDESKELYMLRSIGNRKATIWRQKTPGGKYSRADAQSMKFIPSRNFLDFDQTTRLQGLQ